MRILHVIPQLWRGNGAAKIVKDLVDYQITHGNLVTVGVYNVSFLRKGFKEVGM